MIKLSVKEIARQQKLSGDVQFFSEEIWSFLGRHIDFLQLSTAQQDKCLREKWTPEMFCNLTEMLYFLGQENKYLLAPYPSKINLTGPVLEVKNTIFGHNNSEALFVKFIRPKGMTSKDFDYGYSDEQKRRFADLSLTPKEVSEKMHLFLDVFSFNSDCSLERRRRQRKAMFDVVFSAIMRHPEFSKSPQLRQEMFHKIDSGLSAERMRETDTEWGSLHHVLYGLCSGTDLYHAPQWMNPKSRYNLLCFVRPALSLLQESFSKK